MTNQVQHQQNKQPPALKTFFESANVQNKIKELVGKNAATFATSVMQIANSNVMLKTADPMSIFNAACMAATLNLPLQNGLGFAYIVPFKNNKEKKTEAQFQIGYKGFIQLAQRSGQFKRLVALPVYKKQLIKKDFINGFEFDWEQEPEKDENPIGYYAYFKLVNDFSAELYMSHDDIVKHAQRYSQTFKKGFGVWHDNFEAMALKGLDIETDILTTKGFKKIGDLTKSDIVFDINGKPTEIIAISDRKHLECYKVCFSNGSEIICDEEHDWIVRIDSKTIMKNGILYPKYETRNIKELFEIKEQNKKLTIPTASVEMPYKELPIDPYLLGYWIGNGSKSAAALSCDAKDVEHISLKVKSAGFDTNYTKDKRSNACQINISRFDKSTRVGGLRELLFEYDLLNNKHIPDCYLLSSVEQRISLIQGLFDADASIDKKRGRVTFSQVNEDIVDSVYDILCSLGEAPNKTNHKGFGYGKEVMVYQLQFTPTRNYFTLPRKRALYKEREARNSWAISSIEKCQTVESVCIGVASETKSFLASRSLIPTHNTVIKLLLSKQAPLSVEMQQAVLADQAVVKDVENQEFNYTDNIQEAEFLAVVDEATFEQCKQSIANGETTLQELCDSGAYEFSQEQLTKLEELENQKAE